MSSNTESTCHDHASIAVDAKRLKRNTVGAVPPIASSPHQLFLPLLPTLQGDSASSSVNDEPSPETRGAVFTRPWVVRLLLDLAGYVPERDLGSRVAVEPAVGGGAFLTEMARRLVTSCRLFSRPLSATARSLVAYEIDARSAEEVRRAVARTLMDEGAEDGEAEQLACGWVLREDYLWAAPTMNPVDFVIGNPPYVRLENIDPATASLYRGAYRTMAGRADLYVAFFEAALRSLKPDGVCAFICADRWMRNQYGAELRRLITSGAFAVETVLEMHDADAFEEEVSAYPAITVIRRRIAGSAPSPARTAVAWARSGLEDADRSDLVRALSEAPDHTSRVSSLTVAHISPWFAGSDPWPHVPPDRLALLRRLEAAFETLESAAMGT